MNTDIMNTKYLQDVKFEVEQLNGKVNFLNNTVEAIKYTIITFGIIVSFLLWDILKAVKQ
jgi:hypothetical protein